MSKVDTVTLKDASENKYEFGVYTLDTEWRDVGAIYGYWKKTGNKYSPLYIGKAKSMRDRHEDHEKWEEAKKRGVTHIMVRAISDEKTRQSVEKALISFYQPPMNTHHVKQQTAGKSGLYR